MDERFTRTEQLIGSAAMEKLAKARVAVFGLGAVGSFAVESLARSGVGEFILIDFDRVRHSNFNRQLPALESNLGRLKAELMSERIREINPAAKVTVHAVFADNQNFERLLENGPDTVIDAIDSLNPKTELISFCVARGIPIISSMGAGARLDPLAVRAGDISEIHTCALARRIRRQLKRNHGIDTGLRCVYSIEKPRKPAVAPKIEEEYYQRGRRRIPVGTISYLPAMFGLMISSEVMSLLIGEQGAA